MIVSLLGIKWADRTLLHGLRNTLSGNTAHSKMIAFCLYLRCTQCPIFLVIRVIIFELPLADNTEVLFIFVFECNRVFCIFVVLLSVKERICNLISS